MYLLKENKRKKPTTWQKPDGDHWARQGLVAHYLMNEGGGNKLYDVSGNGNHGTFVGSPVWTSGRSGSAISLDGSSSYVNLGQPPLFSFTNGATFCGWFNHTSGTYNRIFAQNINDPRFYIKHEVAGGNAWRAVVKVGSTNYETVDTVSYTTYSGIWTFVSATYNNSALVLYMNGIFRSQNTSMSGVLDTVSSNYLLGYENGPVEYFNGMLDNIRIYNRALTATEIQELYWNEYPEYTDRIWVGTVAAGGANAPTGHIYGPLVGALGGAI